MHGIVFNTGTVATRVVVVARDRFQFCLVDGRSRTNREVYNEKLCDGSTDFVDHQGGVLDFVAHRMYTYRACIVSSHFDV